MEDPAKDNEYQKAKREAKEFYSRIGHVWCATLNEYVAFNAVGFRHLMRKHGKLRQKSEQKRRFRLLEYAQEILESPDSYFVKERTVEEVVKWRGRKILKNVSAKFWSLKKRKNGRIVNLIVRQLEANQVHFFSIY